MAVVGGIAAAGVVSAGASAYSANKAGKAAKKAGREQGNANVQAAELQAEAQREALDYMKDLDAIPRQYRERSLTQLGGLYGPDNTGQEALISKVKGSPMYEAIMGTRDYGEDAIMRNASATGGLRSGNVQQNLYEYNQRLANDALLQSYDREVEGIRGLSNLPSLGPSIARQIEGIGATNASGVLGESNARTAGDLSKARADQSMYQAIGDGVSGLVGLYGQYGGGGGGGSTVSGPNLPNEKPIWNYPTY